MQEVHKVAVNASGAKIPLNEDKDEGSTTARDSSPDLIAPSQEGNSKVGGSQEDGNASRPSNQENKSVSIASLLSDYIPLPLAPGITAEATERSKEGSCSESDTPEVALVANVNEAEPPEDPLTVTDITDSIRLLVSITDVEEFADKSYYFGLAVVDFSQT